MNEMLPHAWDTLGGFKGLPSPQTYQHCIDEAQKAERVLSAVSCMYVCMYVCNNNNSFSHACI